MWPCGFEPLQKRQLLKEEKIEIIGYSFDVPKDPFVSKVLSKLKKGEVFSNIVEDDYSFKVIRLIDEDKKKLLPGWIYNYEEKF